MALDMDPAGEAVMVAVMDGDLAGGAATVAVMDADMAGGVAMAPVMGEVLPHLKYKKNCSKHKETLLRLNWRLSINN